METAAAKIEPKAWFSAERTFLHWAKIAMVFATMSALQLSGVGDVPDSWKYGVETTGACPIPVPTGEQCARAGAAMSLVHGRAAIGDDLVGSALAPPGCYAEAGMLLFNNGGGNTGSCSASQVCVCVVTAEQKWCLFVPAAVVGLSSVLVLVYAYRRHMRQTGYMLEGQIRMKDFADKLGACFLAVFLTIGIVSMIGSTMLAHYDGTATA